jgi:GntR family negative regulator for fad regulon and positive regulator of fabA
MNSSKPIKPAQHAEFQLMTSILQGEFGPGTHLPGERELAIKLGITRPTLRETLHKLAAEGWITIQHGKQTVVNDYWKTGGLRLLSTIIKYSVNLPPDFILHLLEVRSVIFPSIARTAAKNNPEAILAHLKKAETLDDSADVIMFFDWELQMLIASESGNPVWTLLLNDFSSVFGNMASQYFSIPKNRTLSMIYYKEFTRALSEGGDVVEAVVKSALKNSIASWKDMIREQK